MRVYLASLRPGLPRSVYVLQSGLVINALGNGAANPFVYLYLYNVRGIPLAVVGLVGTLSASCSLVAAAVAGSCADRYGAKPTMVVGLFVSVAGWSLLPLVHEPWQALAITPLTGGGIGIWLTMQSTALALIVPQQLRHAAFAQQRVAANLGLGFGGFVGGLIVTTARPATFTVLFRLNGVTFAVYSAFILRLRLPPQQPRPPGTGGYREVARDRVFVRFLALNVAFLAASVALINGLFPVFAKNEIGASEDAIGVFFLLNSLLIIVAQLPVAKAIEGRRRASGLAGMCALFAFCWGLVEVAGLVSAAAGIAIVVAAIICLSLGECLYDAITGPLVADLAPEGKTGRYMAANGLSWQLAFILTPLIGGAVLGAEALALWPLVIAVAAVAAVYALRFEKLLPVELRLTPYRAAPPPAPPAPTPAGQPHTAEP
jgi:MFS family permease